MGVQRKSGDDGGIEKGLYRIGLILSAAALAYFLCYRIRGFRIETYLYPCVFHAITGYYCPGCGTTRAVYALFQGKLWKSFCYQPFVPYAAVLGGWFLFSQSVERISKGKIAIGMRYRDGYLWLSLILLAANFFIKNMALFLFHIDLLVR